MIEILRLKKDVVANLVVDELMETILGRFSFEWSHQNKNAINVGTGSQEFFNQDLPYKSCRSCYKNRTASVKFCDGRWFHFKHMSFSIQVNVTRETERGSHTTVRDPAITVVFRLSIGSESKFL